MPETLLVDGLPLSYTESDLAALFAQAGTVVSAHIVRNHQDRSTRLGRVAMATADEADCALRLINGKVLCGLSVLVSRPADTAVHAAVPSGAAEPPKSDG